MLILYWKSGWGPKTPTQVLFPSDSIIGKAKAKAEAELRELAVSAKKKLDGLFEKKF